MAAKRAQGTAVPEKRGFKPVPIRFLLPNLLTLLALCSGVTAIRFASEGRFELAVTAIIFAIVLDALDGRLARMLKGTSRFGAELDSLADFVNFGVTPALVVYFWSLNGLYSLGWVVCLLLVIACALRLARFNVTLDDPARPEWMGAFFTGIPAPAGAGLALLPLYLGFLGVVNEGHPFAKTIAVYEVVIACLMVSRIPIFSGKSLKRVPREYVLPLLAGMALFMVLLISYPWQTLVVLSVMYGAVIPLSALAYARAKSANGG